MDMRNEVLLEQRQFLSQNQIQSLEILAMDSQELNQFLQEEYLENPLLDYSGKSDSSAQENFCFADESREKGDIPGSDDMAVKNYLFDQLPRKNFTDAQWNLMGYLIDCLDDTGFFTFSAQEVSQMTGAPVSEIEYLLGWLRSLEPYGIFASDLKHCLLRQLELKGLENTPLWTIVEKYLEDVAEGRISTISRALKLSTLEVRQYVEMISQLNPRPMAEFAKTHEHYIEPDIIFAKSDSGCWRVELNDNWVEDYHLNDFYLRMMNESKDEVLKQYFREKLERVRFIQSSIAQRRQTVCAISEKVLDREMNFLEGKGFLEPMTMGDVAEELHIHASTVSRAIRGKYIQCPKGTIFMKNLFTTSGVKAAGDTVVGAMEIKQAIRELIDGENKKKPYSDQALLKILQKRGIDISRRVIAKYRDEMNIPGSFDRKEI